MMMTPSMDQGMTVNHHLEVHITRNVTGAVVNDVTPTFRLTSKATAESRDLPQIMGTYGVEMGSINFHYGQTAESRTKDALERVPLFEEVPWEILAVDIHSRFAVCACHPHAFIRGQRRVEW